MDDIQKAFEILGIEETRDIGRIKSAYAKGVAKKHPEENPQEWEELYEAYQTALEYAGSDGRVERKKITEPQKTETRDVEEAFFPEEIKKKYEEQFASLMHADRKHSLDVWKAFMEQENWEWYAIEEDFWRQFINVAQNAAMSKKAAAYLEEALDKKVNFLKRTMEPGTLQLVRQVCDICKSRRKMDYPEREIRKVLKWIWHLLIVIVLLFLFIYCASNGKPRESYKHNAYEYDEDYRKMLDGIREQQKDISKDLKNLENYDSLK